MQKSMLDNRKFMLKSHQDIVVELKNVSSKLDKMIEMSEKDKLERSNAAKRRKTCSCQSTSQVCGSSSPDDSNTQPSQRAVPRYDNFIQYQYDFYFLIRLPPDFFFMLVLLRRTSFWPPSMVYISVQMLYMLCSVGHRFPCIYRDLTMQYTNENWFVIS